MIRKLGYSVCSCQSLLMSADPVCRDLRGKNAAQGIHPKRVWQGDWIIPDAGPKGHRPLKRRGRGLQATGIFSFAPSKKREISLVWLDTQYSPPFFHLKWPRKPAAQGAHPYWGWLGVWISSVLLATKWTSPKQTGVWIKQRVVLSPPLDKGTTSLLGPSRNSPAQGIHPKRAKGKAAEFHPCRWPQSGMSPLQTRGLEKAAGCSFAPSNEEMPLAGW